MIKYRRVAWMACSMLSALSIQSAKADTWSQCVQITSVTDFSGSAFLVGIPDLQQPQCAATGTAGTLWVMQGQGPAGYQPNADTMKLLRTSALVAKVAGQKVMIYFAHQQTPQCYVGIIALGGYAMQCN